MRLTLWWSKKADWVMDGEEWGLMAGLCVAAGREGGSKEGGREAVRHVNCGNADCRMSALGWALDRARW